MKLDRFRWCERVCEQVRFRPDHRGIKRELEAHMEDCCELLMASGMEAEAAEAAMLERMGDPAEVGKALDRVHKPLLGWLWKVSRWLVILCAIIFGFLLVTVFGRLGISLEDLPSVTFADGERVRDCRDFCAGYLLVVENAAVWENSSSSDGEGDVKLSMKVWDILGSGSLWAVTDFYALDDRGNEYSGYTSEINTPGRTDYVYLDRRGNRIVSDVYLITVCGVPLDARWVELRCGGGERQVCLRVELPKGVTE